MVSWKGRAVLISMVIGLIPAPGRAADAPRLTTEEKADRRAARRTNPHRYELAPV